MPVDKGEESCSAGGWAAHSTTHPNKRMAGRKGGRKLFFGGGRGGKDRDGKRNKNRHTLFKGPRQMAITRLGLKWGTYLNSKGV